jgi:predicted short-subunit dehydrogenase-like oxidoreductase (DUF2520 family)
VTTIRIIGPGRAGLSFKAALEQAGADVLPLLGRNDDLVNAAYGTDVVLVTASDRSVGDVAEAMRPVESTAVLHVSGSLGLDVLSGHPRRGSLHPLVTLPDPLIGSRRLSAGAWFAVAGDPAASDLVALLGGHTFTVPEGSRTLYHAAASVAANHFVALLGEVERIANQAGIPFEAFLPLVAGALEDVSTLGPARALTGPVVRGDRAVVEAHRAALDPGDLAGYDAGVELARKLLASSAPARTGAPAWS